MYPYHSPDMYKDFLGMLIPVLLVFGLALAVGFLIRYIIENVPRRKSTKEARKPEDYEELQSLINKAPYNKKQDSDKKPDKKLDEYHV